MSLLRVSLFIPANLTSACMFACTKSWEATIRPQPGNSVNYKKPRRAQGVKRSSLPHTAHRIALHLFQHHPAWCIAPARHATPRGCQRVANALVNGTLRPLVRLETRARWRYVLKKVALGCLPDYGPALRGGIVRHAHS